MQDLVREAERAHEDGRYHDYLALEIERLEALHAAAKAADPVHYRGDVIVRTTEMLRACDRAMWQMKEALGYPIPYTADAAHPGALAGSAGNNPFRCGSCEARKAYPDLHLKHDAERQGGMYVAPDQFKTA